jgi:hypothetical protein
MHAKEFNKVVDKQILTCRDILVKKAGEYATDADRLYNFKAAANLQGCTQRQALAGIMVKHTISIFDMCQNPALFELERWDEKITDHLNYLFLLRAVVQEEWDMAYAANAFPELPDTDVSPPKHRKE